MLSIFQFQQERALFLSSSSTQNLGVLSQFACAAQNAASANRLKPVGSTWALPLFYVVQTPAPSSLGHKPTQLRGKERHTAGLSNARQS